MSRRARPRPLAAALLAALALPIASPAVADGSATAGGPGPQGIADAVLESLRRLAAAAPDAAACEAATAGGRVWVGGDASGSDLASLPGPLDLDGTVPAGGRLVRFFLLAARTDVRLEAAPRSAGDPLLAVVDASGVAVAEDDDGGGRLAARIETTLEPGVHCLVASAYGNEAVDVAMRVGRVGHAPLDGGDRAVACEAGALPAIGDGPLDAVALARGVRVEGTAGQRPAWRFALAETLPLTIVAESVAGDPVVRLVDGDGAILAENDDADGTDSRIDLPEGLGPGDYCLEVSDLNGGGNLVEVGLARHDAAAERRRRIDAAELSPLPGDDVAVRDLGAVGASLIADLAVADGAAWTRFEVPEDGVLAIEAIGHGVDPAVVLFDRVGRRLGENDDGPGGLDSLLLLRVRAGAHVLAVRPAVAGTPGHVRLLIERFAPARTGPDAPAPADAAGVAGERPVSRRP